ncbi:MAG: hypothetical protein JG782_1656 [Anaerophaga sp.]|uniref:hypothetical protein n=1 Tax=Anaerophaga thermohalophila TaxID=177400 RepID=UPI000237BC86|nr:hypothetical protein [Anaerophaga thermohalophila]MBZ4677036.1 hypothetical protein [Anaerophaga sp.]
MKHYRIKVRDDKAKFLQELLRYLDFLDYEEVENFSEPRVYTNFELKSGQEKKKRKQSKIKEQASSAKSKDNKQESSAESLREVLARIDQMRDQVRKNK